MLTGGDARRVQELEKVTYLWQAGKDAEAQAAAREILVIRTRVQGAGHWQTADARRRLRTLEHIAALPAEIRATLVQASRQMSQAKRLYAQGKYAEAEPLWRKALEIRRKALGEDHPHTADSYNNVAVYLNARGRYAEAEALSRKALEIRRKALGDDHPHTAGSYNNVAVYLHAQGRHAEAEALSRKALEIRRKALGDDHPHTAQSYSDLAVYLGAQGRHAEAEAPSRKALEIWRKALGDDHPHTAAGYDNLAGQLDAQGRCAEAEALSRKGLEIYRKALGEDHPHTAQSNSNLAANLHAQGKYAEAEALSRKALEIFRKALGEDHPHTAGGYNNVAVYLNVQGRYAEAEAVYRKALESCRKALGDDHPHTARSYSNLAANLGAQVRYAEAEALYRRALEIRRKALGDDHPHTAGNYHSVALCLNAQGRHAEAEALWTKAARSFGSARLLITMTGLERAPFSAERSPLPHLAAVLARRGKPGDAWQQLEADFARGLFDDLVPQLPRLTSPEERDRQQELFRKLRQLDVQIAAVRAARPATEELRKKADALAGRRLTAQADLSQFESAMKRKYGVAQGRAFDLARIQKQLPAGTALLAWLDIPGRPKAADPDGEHWACVVRHRGQPAWVRLPGSGPRGAWTDADDGLPDRVRQTYAERPADPAADWKELARRLHAQRLAPVAPHLRGGPGLPPVDHLVVLPSPSMRGIPVEALTDRYTISYAPSGTIFAWLHEQRRAAPADRRGGPPSLLALGDPVFARPQTDPVPLPAPPAQGGLITLVAPGSHASRGGLEPGDVLLRYAGTPLSGPDDLAPALQKVSQAGGQTAVPVQVWRAGRKLELTVPVGPLGVRLHPKPAPAAVAARRADDELVRSPRGKAWAPLPGTGLEVEAIAKLFAAPHKLTLVGSQASEQRLDHLAAGGDLRRFRFLHFATHGELDGQRPMQSALVLAQDRLPDSLEQVLAGKEVYDGRLTAEHVLRFWKLDADLVTLSACRSGAARGTTGVRATSASRRPSSCGGHAAWC
jgi:tetratricopeptide (TPR) repeat protein